MDNYRRAFIDAHLVHHDKEIIKMAITDHLLWKWLMYNMMLGFETISITDVASHTQCRLGVWYYGEISAEIQQLQAFKDLEEPHKKAHLYAKKAVEHFER